MLSRYHKGLDHFIRVLLVLRYLESSQTLILHFKQGVNQELRREWIIVFCGLDLHHPIFGLGIDQLMIANQSLDSDLRIFLGF